MQTNENLMKSMKINKNIENSIKIWKSMKIKWNIENQRKSLKTHDNQWKPMVGVGGMGGALKVN